MSLSVFARSEGANNNDVGGTVEYTDHSVKNTSENTEEIDELEEKPVSDSDSSYYSVNKFNFLFYFVYKTNFMKEEVVEEEIED